MYGIVGAEHVSERITKDERGNTSRVCPSQNILSRIPGHFTCPVAVNTAAHRRNNVYHPGNHLIWTPPREY